MLTTVEPVLQVNLGAIRGSRRAGRVGRSVTTGPGAQGSRPEAGRASRLGLGSPRVGQAPGANLVHVVDLHHPRTVEGGVPIKHCVCERHSPAHGRRMRIFAHDESLSAR